MGEKGSYYGVVIKESNTQFWILKDPEIQDTFQGLVLSVKLTWCYDWKNEQPIIIQGKQNNKTYVLDKESQLTELNKTNLKLALFYRGLLN